MQRQGDEVHVSEEEACGASRSNHLRYILGFSLVLVVVLMSLIWIVQSVIR